MAEIADLERVISNLSGFNPEKELPSSTQHGHDVDVEKALPGSRGTSAGGTLSPPLEDQKELGPGPEEDENIVWWDGPDDPQNPMNWPTWRKVISVGIASGITFVTPLASSMFAPGVPELMEEFKSTNTLLAAFVVSVYILGFAVGPLFLSPASEIYGRRIIFNISNICFVAFTIACAKSKSMGMLVAFRFLAGCVGAAPMTIGGGTIADVIAPAKRGAAMAIFAMGPLMGPVIGPVAGGFLAQAKGWRWVFWILTIVSGFMTIITFVFLKETYAPRILRDKATRLRKETGNTKLRSKLESPLPNKELFKRAMYRPLKMLFTSPIVFGLSSCMAVIYGYLYLLFTTFTNVFEGQYGFSTGTVGLSYLGIGVGSLIGLVIMGVSSDRVVAARTKKYGVQRPEYRLPPMTFTAPLIPIGLFWYGWSAQAHVHWIVPIMGTSLVGIGLLGAFMPIQTYMLDAFTVYAASALAATTVLRSVLGAVLPLAGESMYAKLGLGWGNSLLAFIALAMCPIPWAFEKWGESIRTRWPVNFD
ncbi:hypothetical protein RUND412_001169 [Rhizina undulata]